MKYFYKIGKNEIWGQFGPSEYNILGACENSLPPNWVLLVLRAYKVINSWKEIEKTNELVIKGRVGNIRTDGRAGATLLVTTYRIWQIWYQILVFLFFSIIKAGVPCSAKIKCRLQVIQLEKLGLIKAFFGEGLFPKTKVFPRNFGS